ncbi:MAG: DUF2281 domain-containing protein [Phormidesmis sp.]
MQEIQAMSHVLKKIVESLSALPPEKQQEVLDFIEFLRAKLHASPTDEQAQPEPTAFYKASLSKYSGCVDSGHTDLSTNKNHMKDFGRV